MLMLLSGCVLSSMILSSDYRDNRNPARIEEMMRLIHEEGELPPFPTTATELWVQTSGNMFSRTFYGPTAGMAGRVRGRGGLVHKAPALGVRRLRGLPGLVELR